MSGSSLILSGDISGTGRVNVLSGADVLLSGDNSGFDGENGALWNVEAGAAVSITRAANLGESADVLLNGALTLRSAVPAEGNVYVWRNALAGSGNLVVNLSSEAEEFAFGGTSCLRHGPELHGHRHAGDGHVQAGRAG